LFAAVVAIDIFLKWLAALIANNTAQMKLHGFKQDSPNPNPDLYS